MLHLTSSGKYKLKQRGDTTTQLSELPGPGTLTTPDAGGDVRHQEPSFIAGGKAQWYHYSGGWFRRQGRVKRIVSLLT